MHLSAQSSGKKVVPLALLIVLVTLTILTWYGSYYGLRRSEIFREIRVGKKIPSFAASSYVSDKPMGPTDPPGNFYIHFINDQLPATCLDLECGDDARHVVEKGGHLLGFADGKAAYAFGIKIKLKPYRFDASIMAVTDDKANIIAIYENAQLADLKTIVKELQL